MTLSYHLAYRSGQSRYIAQVVQQEEISLPVQYSVHTVYTITSSTMLEEKLESLESASVCERTDYQTIPSTAKLRARFRGHLG